MNYVLVFRRLSLLAFVAAGVAVGATAPAQSPALESKPDDPFFADYNPVKAPATDGLFLKPGDRLAICGDSITEQKMYSRMMETYLTVCVPELNLTVRQYGWSGETAEGFLHRMTNDCLRFNPTIATTCYGMNDHRYRAYEQGIGTWYSNNMVGIVEAFKGTGTRVILGSAGCVGKVPGWVQTGGATVSDMNHNLCILRNIDVDIASNEKVRFADVFWPMLTAGFEARQKFGNDYYISGKDGVHPGNSGHLVMARAFLKAMGLDGEIGTYTVDLKANTASATKGHEVESCKDGVLEITSHRYPYCATGAVDRDDSVRSAMGLVPFNSELNRLTLVVKNAEAADYKVTWGSESKTYSAEQLAKGVNLANDFEVNPFSKAFAKVESAVQAKQNYETRQIKDLFHGEEGRADMDATAALTEKVRERLANAIPASFVPVKHTIKIEAQ